MATECAASSGPSEREGEASGQLKNPFVGNVSKHIPLPAEHSRAVKRGNLQFDSCFEGG